MSCIKIDKAITEKLGGYFSKEDGYGMLFFDPANDCSISISVRDEKDNIIFFKPISKEAIKENNIIIAYDIDWDINASEITEALDVMRVFDAAKKASEIFGISEAQYVNMHTAERHDAIYVALHHSPGMGDDFFDLPSAILIPEEVWIEGADDNDVITDWLSNEYGFCINGYKLSADI